MSHSIPPPEHPHTWAELLTLVGAIRQIAYDVTLEAGDALRRIAICTPSTKMGVVSFYPIDGPHLQGAGRLAFMEHVSKMGNGSRPSA